MFPVWSDLGDISSETRSGWEKEISIRSKYKEYFTGNVFKAKVPDEHSSHEDAPELYPLGINLVKTMCLAITDSIFGEWDEDIVRFESRKDTQLDDNEEAASKLAGQILDNSYSGSMLWEIALDREIYGGGAIKISPDFSSLGRIKFTRIPIDSFYPVWDPDDIDRIIELYIVVKMTKEQARNKYGYDGSKNEILRIEHWTLQKYETTIDGKRINSFTGKNPWGFIPVEYIPRYRSTHWWGDALTEDLMRPQDELNMRLADMGEAINYNAQPTRYGYNLPRTFNSNNFPVSPNAMWDLGRVIGASPEPKVGILEASNPLPSGTFEYINFIYNWARVSSFAPPIIFGEDDGGGQRSGITLEIRMLPLIKAVRRSRSYLSVGLIRAMKKAAKILIQKDFTGMPKMGLRRLSEGSLTPRFAPLLPRDQAAITDMVVKLMSTTPPSLSIETAVKILGLGTSELDRIEGMLLQDNLYKRAGVSLVPGMDSGTGVAPGGRTLKSNNMEP
jgi:hypothetical protein